jgi:protein CpxP
MFKQCLLALVAAGSLAVAVPFLAAQDSPSNDQQSSAPPGGGGEHRHGPPDPAERTRELAKHLKLTNDQQAKVQDLLQSERTQMDSLHQDTSLSQEDRRSKMMDIHKNTDTQIRATLDSTQQKKWDEMQSRREQWMQHRGPGAPGSSDQPPPPPPQQ